MILLDFGHGADTKGKSFTHENGVTLHEYEINRDLGQRVAYHCKMNGIPFAVIVTEAADVSLSERVARANKIARRCPWSMLLSIHCNASAKHNAGGWEVHTSPGTTQSDAYARIMWKEAQKELGKATMRADWSDGDPDWDSKFTVLTKTVCPAMLVENLFFDYWPDAEVLRSEEGRERLALIMYRGIKRIWETYGKHHYNKL